MKVYWITYRKVKNMKDYSSEAYEIFRTLQLIQRWEIDRFHKFNKEMERPKLEHELTVPQFHMLIAIRNYGPLNLKELSRNLNVSPPAASLMLDRLYELGLVVREQSSEDRREIQISLTKEAEEILQWHEQQILFNINELLQNLGKETSSQWVDVNKKISQYLTSVLKKEKEEVV